MYVFPFHYGIVSTSTAAATSPPSPSPPAQTTPPQTPSPSPSPPSYYYNYRTMHMMQSQSNFENQVSTGSNTGQTNVPKYENDFWGWLWNVWGPANRIAELLVGVSFVLGLIGIRIGNGIRSIVVQTVSNAFDGGQLLNAHSVGALASALISVFIDSVQSIWTYGSYIAKLEIIGAGGFDILTGGAGIAAKVALLTATVLVPFFIELGADFRQYQQGS
jgi:hypothetical protein